MKIPYKKEVGDTLFLIAFQGFNYIAPLLVFPYLMIVLGAHHFGLIGFSLSVAQYFMLIIDFGFNLSATKRVALAKDNKEKLSSIFFSTQLAKIILLFACALILVILAEGVAHFQAYRPTMYLLFIMAIGHAFSFVWFFQGIGKIRIVSLVNIISKLCILPLTFVLVKNPEDYMKAALILSLVYVLSALISLGIIYYKRLITPMKTTLRQIIQETKESFPIFLSQAATTLYTTVFVVILGYLSNPEEVGKYTAVEKIVRGISFLIYIPISYAFYPKITILAKENRKASSRLVRQLALLLFGINLILSMVLLFFADNIAGFLGEDYAHSSVLFQIMAFLPMLISLGAIFGQMGLLAMGNRDDRKKFQSAYFIAGIISIILVFSLTQKYLSTGVAFSLVITEFSVFLMMFWFSRKNVFYQQN